MLFMKQKHVVLFNATPGNKANDEAFVPLIHHQGSRYRRIVWWILDALPLPAYPGVQRPGQPVVS